MLRRIALVAAGLLALVGTLVMVAPPVQATQLPLGIAAWHITGPCSSWSVYDNGPVNGWMHARQDTNSYALCGGAGAYITLVFFDPVFGLLNVICQAGSNITPSLSGLGQCNWDSYSATEYAHFHKARPEQVPFGMKVDYRWVDMQGKLHYEHWEYAIF